MAARQLGVTLTDFVTSLDHRMRQTVVDVDLNGEPLTNFTKTMM